MFPLIDSAGLEVNEWYVILWLFVTTGIMIFWLICQRSMCSLLVHQLQNYITVFYAAWEFTYLTQIVTLANRSWLHLMSNSLKLIINTKRRVSKYSLSVLLIIHARKHRNTIMIMITRTVIVFVIWDLTYICILVYAMTCVLYGTWEY